MQKAIYSEKPIGHFGHGLVAYYSHFTSPIRRYPDLLLHRMIQRLPILNKPRMQKFEIKKLKKSAYQTLMPSIADTHQSRSVKHQIWNVK